VSYSSTNQSFEVAEQSFSFTANEWYRQFTYQMEEDKNKPKDILEHFNKFGSSGLKSFDQNQKIFQKETLWLKCPSVKRLHDQAKSSHFLEHEARLFLCSILTYNEESINYLHEILSNCEDYNPSKSQAHINDWIRRRELGIGGRPYTCERANSVGVGCGSCSLEKKNKWVKVGDRFIETQEKSSPSPVRFAYKSSSRKEE
jgi:DNA primase large subunit